MAKFELCTFDKDLGVTRVFGECEIKNKTKKIEVVSKKVATKKPLEQGLSL